MLIYPDQKHKSQFGQQEAKGHTLDDSHQFHLDLSFRLTAGLRESIRARRVI
jgi:hypothetical protein